MYNKNVAKLIDEAIGQVKIKLLINMLHSVPKQGQ